MPYDNHPKVVTRCQRGTISRISKSFVERVQAIDPETPSIYSMRQDHKGGEKLFVDYGEGLSLLDPQSSDPITTQLFVAVWGASTYTFAEATLTQQLPDWIGSHTRAFDYFGCVPKIVVPDCLKSAVSRACRYEPEINPTYADMANHYGICVLPARPARPRDKPYVSYCTLFGASNVESWLLGRAASLALDDSIGIERFI